MSPAERVKARRVFEETLANVLRQYTPAEDVMLEALTLNDQGQQVVVARYKLSVDGRVECFALLDEALWPSA